MFFPISLVMIGSWLIDRESTHDTLKNIMTIPVSMPDVLGAKLFWVGTVSYTHLDVYKRQAPVLCKASRKDFNKTADL